MGKYSDFIVNTLFGRMDSKNCLNVHVFILQFSNYRYYQGYKFYCRHLTFNII